MRRIPNSTNLRVIRKTQPTEFVLAFATLLHISRQHLSLHHLHAKKTQAQTHSHMITPAILLNPRSTPPIRARLSHPANLRFTFPFLLLSLLSSPPLLLVRRNAGREIGLICRTRQVGVPEDAAGDARAYGTRGTGEDGRFCAGGVELAGLAGG